MASKRPHAKPRSNDEAGSSSKRTKALDRVDSQYSKERPMPIRVRPSHDFESADRPPKLPSPSKSQQTEIVAKIDKNVSEPRKFHPTPRHSSIPVRVYRKDRHKSQNVQSPTKARIDKLDRREKSTRQPRIPVRVHRSDSNKSQNPQASTNARINKLDRREKSTHQPWVPVRVHSPRPHQPQLAAYQPANNGKNRSLKNSGQKFVIYCDLDGGSIIGSVIFVVVHKMLNRISHPSFQFSPISMLA